jgi:hypothetical protein
MQRISIFDYDEISSVALKYRDHVQNRCTHSTKANNTVAINYICFKHTANVISDLLPISIPLRMMIMMMFMMM